MPYREVVELYRDFDLDRIFQEYQEMYAESFSTVEGKLAEDIARTLAGCRKKQGHEWSYLRPCLEEVLRIPEQRREETILPAARAALASLKERTAEWYLDHRAHGMQPEEAFERALKPLTDAVSAVMTGRLLVEDELYFYAHLAQALRRRD